MVPDTPLIELGLWATSRADDLGFVALSDVSQALGSTPSDYRIIGGHMMTVLVARSGLDRPRWLVSFA